MFKTIRVSLSFIAIFLLLLAPVAGFAQEITGSVRGTVSAPSGEPVAGTPVTVTDTRTGTTRTTTTNDKGVFNVRGLVVGGPYTIRVDSDDYRGTVVTDVFTTLAATSSFNIVLQEQTGLMEEVIVVSSVTVAGADLAIGPSTAFNLAEIQAMPTITRQIRDVIRMDPRVNVGRASSGNGFGVSCLGGSGRANSFSIDGVRTADGFGLNASGFASRNIFPLPFDTVRSASVEFAPVDVQYGSFTGCNINIVTKGGSNEFAAVGFYLLNDESLTGDTINDNIVISEPFEDTNWGVEVSGPIIKDKLFFYVSYEETDEGSAQNTGPIGGGFANERHLTLDDANRIAGILRSQYGRDPGFLVRTLPQFSERTFGRLDWNINDNHRAELTYVKLEESNLEEDDFGFNGFTFSDNFEMEGTEQDSTSFRLFSDWSDNFSTELRLSSLEVQDIQGPLGGGEAQDNDLVRIIVEAGGGSSTDIFASGPGFFRSANDLRYTSDQAKLAGYWDTGDHRFTMGYELDSLDVFNLFIPNATGTLIFDDIDDLEAGDLDFAFFTGSFTQNPSDAAANFARTIHTYYLQDEWQPNDRTTVTAGIRYDTYDSNDVPIYNPIFEARFGFANTQSFDGLDLLMPRIGFTYDMPFDSWGEMQLRGGFGIFSGGDPTVHFSNSYQNFGGALGGSTSFSSPCTSADRDILAGGFTGLPDCMRIAAQNSALQNQGGTAAIQPGFELPSQNRFSLGMSLSMRSDVNFFNDWQVDVDVIYSDHQNSIEYWDLSNTPRTDSNGNIIFLPDGRPQFAPIDPLLAGCNAVFQGPGNGFVGVTPDCEVSRARGSTGDSLQHILMGNGISGQTRSFSFQAAKTFDLGENTSLNFRFGYAYTDSEIGNPVSSSTATSGYEEVAQAVINTTELGPAQYVNEHNFVLGATFKHFFFEDHPTTIGLFFRRRSGRPFSYTYDNPTSQNLFGDSDDEERNLFYVPTGPNDPLVDLSTLSSQGTLDAFFAFLDRSGLSQYAGQISPKNGFNQDWNSDMDVRISQDIPLGDSRNSLKLFLDIENIMNLISDGNNIQTFQRTGDIREGVPVVDASLSTDGTQYRYSNFRPGGTGAPTFHPVSLDVDDSVWRVQVGLKYSFN
jgi:outer membrane receptor protein involved in Fe transport